MKTNMKKEILKKIKKSLENPAEGRNSMGCSESYYYPNYLIGSCFTEDELSEMDETALNDLLKLAEFASDVFY